MRIGVSVRKIYDSFFIKTQANFLYLILDFLLINDQCYDIKLTLIIIYIKENLDKQSKLSNLGNLDLKII